MLISAQFTPWLSLLGGILIGLASSMLLFFFGKICGISGIVGGLLGKWSRDHSWRLIFSLGLISGGLVMVQMMPAHTALAAQPSLPIAIIAGLLVGLGTRLGSGCTSGHGVCGLARRSPRSLIATLCFMLMGFITVFIVESLFS